MQFHHSLFMQSMYFTEFCLFPLVRFFLLFPSTKTFINCSTFYYSLYICVCVYIYIYIYTHTHKYRQIDLLTDNNTYKLNHPGELKKIIWKEGWDNLKSTNTINTSLFTNLFIKALNKSPFISSQNLTICQTDSF